MSSGRAWFRAAMGVALGGVLALGAGAAAFAAEPIRKGVDLWISVAGMARTSFAQEPIPAGFFCNGSQPFTGSISFQGAPLATEPAEALGRADTIVQRLDDAVFDAKGEATTRIQLMALSLVSTRPVATSCGAYDVAVHLADGEQPTTTMRIFNSDALGGTYSAPLSLNVKLVFTPAAGDRSARRELTRRIDLGPAPRSVWVYAKPQYVSGVRVDTRGTGRPEVLLPTPSNFRAGFDPAVLREEGRDVLPACTILNPPPMPNCGAGACAREACHCAELANGQPDMSDPCRSSAGCAHVHCLWYCVSGPAWPNGTCKQALICPQPG
jgi:hypothetical protein